jgi:hypothetical protein
MLQEAKGGGYSCLRTPLPLLAHWPDCDGGGEAKGVQDDQTSVAKPEGG